MAANRHTFDPLDLLAGTTGRASYGNLLLARQKQAFRNRESGTIEDLLQSHPDHTSYPGTLFDLILAEIAERRRRGEAPALDDYVHRFPQMADALEIAFDPEFEELGSSAVRSLGKRLDAVIAPPSQIQLGTAAPATTPGIAADSSSTVIPGIPGYSILSVLGRGGMGVVYKAIHLRLDRVVALKMMAGPVHNPVRRLRFLAEADAVARLAHPNIVQLYEIGEYDNATFFTLEYCARGSLLSVAGNVPMKPREAAAIVATLAEAMEYAHSQQVLHRDLKPENILLADDGTPKIADFGLARRLDEDEGLTASGDVIGTPAYMAPEQANPRGRNVGPLADVYGLAAILYRLLTGQTPFSGATAISTLQAVSNEAPINPRRIVPSLDRDLESICLLGLEKEPQHRYASAALLAADLRRYLNHESVLARPVPLITKAYRWARHHCLLAASLAVLAGGLVLLSMISVFAAITARQNAQLQNDALRAEHVRELAAARHQQTVHDSLQRIYTAMNHGQFTEAERDLRMAYEFSRVAELPEDFRGTLARADADLAFLMKLEDLQVLGAEMESGVLADDGFDASNRTDQAYESLFRQHGLDVFASSRQDLLVHLQTSPIRGALSTAVIDWVNAAEDPSRLTRLLDLARELSDDAASKRMLLAFRDKSPEYLQALTIDELSALPAEFASTSAQWRLQANDPAGAIQILKAVLAHRPNDFWLNINLGKVLRSRGDAGSIADAVGYFRTATALRPRSVGARVQLATALNLSGKPEEGFEVCRVWLESGRSSAPVHFVMGRSWQIRKEAARAMECYRQSLSANANYTLARYNLAILLKAEGQPEEAAREYRECLQRAPRYAPAYVNLANLHLQANRANEAEPLLREAIRLQPKLTMAHNSLGSALENLGRFDDAARAYRTALDLEPDQDRIRKNLERVEKKTPK